MSQQKVDYYKEQKRNRRQIMKKEKTMRRLEIAILIAVLAALIVWFGYLIYTNAKSKNAGAVTSTTNMDLSAWENYTENIDALINGEEIVEETTDEPAEDAGEEAEEAEEAEEEEAVAEDEGAGEAEEPAEETEESAEESEE